MLPGTFPTRLKYAIVKLLLKKGDKENVANYRPIYLLTSFSKEQEKMIHDRLLKESETNNNSAIEQFDFRTSSSTEIAPYKPSDDILNVLNNRMEVGGMFCDLQKAFNYANHEILLTKLEFYGITGLTNKLIKSYLPGRHQSVVLNNHSSSSCLNWGEITHGAPQGSILGSLHF
jgi:hypothetical protein